MFSQDIKVSAWLEQKLCEGAVKNIMIADRG